MYNNAKTIGTRYIFFILNYGYYLCIFLKNNINFHFRLKLANKLVVEFKNMIFRYKNNLCYIQKLLKQANNKRKKPKYYIFSKKLWLNSKYIKTKYN